MHVRFAGGPTDMSRLRFSGTGAMHGYNDNPSCHQHGASRVTGPCMMAAFTHFMATLGAPRPRCSGRNGNCSPTRVAYCGCVDHFAARGSCTNPEHEVWLRLHQSSRSRVLFTDNSPPTISTISSMNRSTGTSAICSTTRSASRRVPPIPATS